MGRIILKVSPTGVITTLYTEKLNLAALGRLHVERASNIEYDNATQQWVVTFPDGSRLPQGFGSREAALSAEVAHLQARL